MSLKTAQISLIHFGNFSKNLRPHLAWPHPTFSKLVSYRALISNSAQLNWKWVKNWKLSCLYWILYQIGFFLQMNMVLGIRRLRGFGNSSISKLWNFVLGVRGYARKVCERYAQEVSARYTRPWFFRYTRTFFLRFRFAVSQNCIWYLEI